MFASVSSFTLSGIDAVPVEVEVHLATKGLPRMFMVGLPDIAVKEARRRVEAAINNSEYPNHLHPMIVNLAPAHLRKEGSLLDLAIGLGILAAGGWLSRKSLHEHAVAGELALDGGVRPVRGGLAMSQKAHQMGKRGIILPRANAAEAALCPGVEVVGVCCLREAVDYLEGRIAAPALPEGTTGEAEEAPACMSEVKGQGHAKRALEVAAAGGHNFLMLGPPGSGKTMLARRLCGILPPLTPSEALDVTRIMSVAGTLNGCGALISQRPFRMPHHSISQAGMTGGGTPLPRPGEMTLAHQGVLFLDELPEFRRDALESLRQPLENGWVNISRAMTPVRFPCSTMLVAAMNPCPCGYWGDRARACTCSPGRLHAYREKITGPLIDRFDIMVEVPRLQVAEMNPARAAEPSGSIQARVMEARDRQTRRLDGRCNARMRPAEAARFCKLDAEMSGWLGKAMEAMHLTARGYERCLRIARTIADLDGRDEVRLADLAEAVQYRAPIGAFTEL